MAGASSLPRRNVEDVVNMFVLHKQYRIATILLVDALQTKNTVLQHISALRIAI